MAVVTTKKEAHHLRVKLNRPDKRNALNDEMIGELKHIFRKVNQDAEIRTVSIEGEGKAFCSGADLSYLKKISGNSFEENLADSQSLAKLYFQIYSCEKPVLAVVDGPALAGGCGLASVCDIVIASQKAQFGYPEVRIGFVPALVSAILIRQVGERVAMELMLTGKIITAEEARHKGLANHIEENVETKLAEYIDLFGHNAPGAMATTKNMIHTFTYSEMYDDLNRLSVVNARFRDEDEFKEGIDSFLNKRKPNWTTP